MGLIAPAAFASLDTPCGTMSFGGSISVPIEWDPARGATVSANFQPQMGLFLSENWELVTSLKVKTPEFGKLVYGSRNQYWRWGFSAGANYLFTTQWPVRPFIGLAFGFEIANIAPSTANAAFDVPLGILVPLSDKVALQIGINTQIQLVGAPNVFHRLKIDTGYFGVRAFF